MSDVVRHGPEADLRQTPGPEEWWQDSAFLSFSSASAGIGGALRIGHEPNHGGGLAALWFGLVTHDGTRYRRNVSCPLETADLLPDGFGALGGRYRIVAADGGIRYRVDDVDCRLDLTVHDLIPRTDFFPRSAGSLVDDFASSHFECAGEITGTIELGGRAYEVEGLSYRDRSWGPRRWDVMLNSRWVPGTFGADRTFGSVTWHATDGTLRRFGYVADDGVVHRTEDVETVVSIEPDGLTFREGRTCLGFPDRPALEITCRPYDAIVFEHHGVVDVHGICDVTVDGRLGFCDLTASVNPRAGRGPVTTALHAVATDGLSHRKRT